MEKSQFHFPRSSVRGPAALVPLSRRDLRLKVRRRRGAFSHDSLSPHPICFFLLSHCGLPDGLYYLCFTDSLIRRD
jgi:hypothetical protein